MFSTGETSSNEKQRESTKSRKKKQQNATRQKQQKQQTQQRASASYFSCSLRWCWSNPLPENARSHVSLLFQDASSQERLSRLLPWLPECRRVPLLFHEPRNMQQKKLCEYSQNISVSSLRHANSKIWKWSKVVRVSGDLIYIYIIYILYIYIGMTIHVGPVSNACKWHSHHLKIQESEEITSAIDL